MGSWCLILTLYLGRIHTRFNSTRKCWSWYLRHVIMSYALITVNKHNNEYGFNEPCGNGGLPSLTHIIHMNEWINWYSVVQLTFHQSADVFSQWNFPGASFTNRDQINRHIKYTDDKVHLHMTLEDVVIYLCFNSSRPGQNGRRFADDIFQWIFSKENIWCSIKISLKFIPRGAINNNPPLSEPMVVSLPVHICVTQPQCVNFNGGFAKD